MEAGAPDKVRIKLTGWALLDWKGSVRPEASIHSEECLPEQRAGGITSCRAQEGLQGE